MKNLVVPIDFSEGSINALDHAIIYANNLKAGIHLIHVRKKRPFYSNKLDINSKEIAEDSGITEYLHEIIAKYKDKISTGIDYKIRQGKIYQEIINQAKSNDADLIIMGTHGVSGFEERWIGSNAFRVVSNAACPVVTIRMDYRLKNIGKIVIPIDTTEDTRQKVPFIATLAKIFEAEVFIASVRETKKTDQIEKLAQFTAQAEAYFEEQGIVFQTESLTGKNLADITIEYALETGAHLIGIMTEQHENQRNLLMGTYAQQLVNHSPIPVISFNAL